MLQDRGMLLAPHECDLSALCIDMRAARVDDLQEGRDFGIAVFELSTNHTAPHAP